MTERPRQADRKAGEARAVRKISVAVGLSALGLSCGLASAAAKQGADVPAITPTQPSPAAAEPRQVEEIDEEVIVPVSVPRPPDRAPAAVPRAAPASPSQAVRAGATTVTQAVPPAAAAGATTVAQAAPPAPAARAAAAPKPTAVSTGSPVR